MRGISAGDTLRRLVGKCLARQFAEQLQQAAGPANFGMSTRCGTDGLVHLARALLESDPAQTILCIDGVGAFDHVSRARMFERLLATPSLRPILPFARLWYSRQRRTGQTMPGPRMLCPVPSAGSKGMPSCRGSSASPLPPPSKKSRTGLRPETLWWLTLMTYTSSRVQSVPVQHTTWFVKPCGNSAALRSTRGSSCVGIAWGVFRHRASPSLRLPATRFGVECFLSTRALSAHGYRTLRLKPTGGSRGR